MDREIIKLINCLNMEKNIYIRISELSLSKKDAITKDDINELDRIVYNEKALVKEIIKAEEKRQDIVKQISKHLKIDENQTTVADILENTDNKNYKQQLAKLLGEFSEIINKQKELNKINQSVLKKNLNYIKYLTSAIISGNENNTYSCEGNDNSLNQTVNIFDQRV